ncbi:hypothetical protein [Croceimicrobium sp.]|uniref:hypothetical protein n=1 Tax=Croceimicrobium sp. TaxID=2828340 RepID=UPI003BACC2D7
MRGFSSLALIGVLFLSACGSKKTSAQEKAVPPSAEPQTKVQQEEIEFSVEPEPAEFACIELEKNNQHSDSTTRLVEILDYSQSGNCLRIQYQYSGCSKSKVHLNWISTKDQVELFSLYVEDPGACEMLIQEEDYFDLSVFTETKSVHIEFSNGFKAIYSP